jgi:hypothetical protein
MSTLLTELVRKQTAASVVGVLSRSVDKIVDEMARELLHDRDFRAQVQQLIRTAFLQTLKELNDPAPAATVPPTP